ncbi:HTTM domain-containing protein [Halarchaeum sp. CBA1220]|uniref:HTTM domain-containing protein n=1 Tax=Halarchaeum sp. CBA1220 TaxID=1853682 RepID=UPI002104634F|nr:HTTM domain-containing protein [Halarchaeum sp. CBA1220]
MALPTSIRTAFAALRDGLVDRLRIDTRALAALRVALGLLLLVDLALRARHLCAFYTDAGVLPRAVLADLYPTLSQFSLHALSGDAWLQLTLFALAGAFALMLCLGYHTRAATLASLLLLVSLHARNPLVLNAGDSLLRRLLFWGLFLPLGTRWSVDAVHRGPTRQRLAGVASVASAGLLLQVVVVYVVNALFKHRGELWLRGDAVRYVFSLREFTVLLGPALAGHALLLTAADWLWLALIAASPLLVLVTGRARTALAACFLGAHLGMLLTLRVGVFPLVSAAALLVFLHGGVWARVERRVARVAARAGGRRLGALAGRLPRAPRPSFRLPAAVSRVGRAVVPVALCVLLVAALAWNAVALGALDVGGSDEASVAPSEYSWNMFAPDPPRSDRWFVAPARTANGSTVNALTGRAVTWTPPDEFAAQYPSARWRKYLSNVWKRDDARLTGAYAGYLCERWNATHDADLVAIDVAVARQATRLSGPEPIAHRTLWSGRCSATP